MTREEAKKTLKTLMYYPVGTVPKDKCVDALNMAIEALQADTVEVVRCKDCVFKNGCNRCVVTSLLGDNSVSVKTSDVDFCSYGEKSEE